MQLIVGLGNPGNEYRHHRHNIGFMALDAIARAHNFPGFKSKFNGLIAEGNIQGAKVLLLKPQTFMNRSGNSVGAAAKFYKIPPQDITVLYDELDLAPGKVRVKIGGGTGGHNGLRSIDPVIGNNYQRVRLGIGHPGHKDLVTRHVLGNFAKADAQWLEPLLDAIGENADLLLKGDTANFMNRMALAVGKTSTKEPDKPARKGQKKPQKVETGAPEKNTSVPGPMAALLNKLFSKDI